MSEGWEDCPVLPVGWKRREVYRRSGATIGKSDTYYMSPTAERFRSKVEMVKYFGESIDLSYFDFKRGIIVSPDAKMRRSVKRLSASPSGRDEGQPRPCQDPKKKPKTETEPALALALASPLPLADSPAANGAGMGGLNAEPLDTLIACCEGCQQWVPGVLFGPGKRHVRFYCAECRAKRRELGRKLNYYKRFGCGECTGCAVPSDCGECRSCAARSGGSGKRWTCERRWCHKLKEIKAETQGRKSLGEPKKVKLHTHRTKKMMIYRTLPPDTAHEPAPTPSPTPGAQAHMPTKKIKSAHRVEKMLQKAKAGPGRKLHAVQQENPALQPTPPTNAILAGDTPSTPCAESTEASGLLPRACRGRRNSRVCGECTACRRAADCGVCDFCRDKAKFGGANTLRQKCRWKQCLCFASKRLLPREMLGESPWAEWKETGYRGSRRGKWKENVFASRKVARIIQAARKRKIWQSSAHPPADRTPAPRTGTGAKTQPADDVEPAGGRTGSPARSEDGEERAGVHTPVKGSPSLKNSGCGTPEPKSTNEDKALNLKKFLSAMKPFLKGSRFSEAHDRPSVIRETSEWQKSGDSRQSPESTPQKPPAIPTPVPPESPDPDPDPARLPGATLPPEVSIEPAAPPVSRHREHKDRSHKKLPEESGLNGTGGHSLPQRVTEDRTDPSSSDKPPVSPQRPARPEARTPGTPSNSRMIKQGSPEHNQGYGRTPPTPITQIFSLGSPYMMMSLEPLLRTFTHDLMLLPLPASWVVCSSLGPDVQLIQLSRKSPVWDSVVQILPGFHYHVLVRGIPVPPAHRLYRSRPTRLSSAADVLELISDLETYRLCAGFPHLPLLLPTGRGLKVPLPPPVVAALLPHQRSSHCEVLVDKERCSRCTAAI